MVNSFPPIVFGVECPYPVTENIPVSYILRAVPVGWSPQRFVTRRIVACRFAACLIIKFN